MAATDQRRPLANGAAAGENGNRGEVFDQDLFEGGDRFAGFDTSIGVAADEDQDFRERQMARQGSPRAAHIFLGPLLGQVLTLACRAAACRPSPLPKTSCPRFRKKKPGAM